MPKYNYSYVNKNIHTYRNLTPNRVMNRNKINTRRKKYENEEYMDYTFDETEDNLQKEQKQFVKNYRDFLAKLGK